MLKLAKSLTLLLPALLLGACQRQAPPAAASAPQAIAWQEGKVEEAFAEAAESKQDVLLYWGAKWCPPCNQLKATVFQRPEFIAQTRRFVAVHLDGDEPGAQRWGEYFGIVGYPTLIILRPDRSELTRLSGSSDVEAYPRLLALALQQSQPIRQLLQQALAQPDKLSAGDWQSLAAYGWELDEQRLLPAQEPAATLETLAQRCPDPALRQTLALQALTLRAGADERLSEPQRLAGTQLLHVLLADPEAVRRNVVLIEASGADQIAALAEPDSADYGALSALLVLAMDRVYSDARYSLGERIDASFAELDLWQQAHGQDAVPKALAEKIRQRAQWADAQAQTPYERQNAVHSAAELLHKAGLDAEAKALLNAELKRSLAPYYHMVTLSKIAEDAHDNAAAVDWLRQAYAAAQGPATRAQWGVLYVEGLIRLQPEDAKSIQAVGTQLIRELRESQAGYYQRTRKRFERLSGKLLAWAAAHQGQAQLKALRAQMQPLCATLPAQSEAQRSCSGFLQPAA